jgi:pantoate--beta-alanine ligase
MKVIRTVAELQVELQTRSAQNEKIGFVPTMGYLHAGHMSLLDRAKHENEVVVLSIFVNPLQFGPNEDFDRYPRDEDHDLHVAKSSLVDYVFLPSVEEMYPDSNQTMIEVGEIANRLCGASRPGHFNGVATVVKRLFEIVAPNKAYFGLKDAQQVAVLENLVNDYKLPVEIVPCPIVREKDGLAMSSRNVYLTNEERKQALAINESLVLAKKQFDQNQDVTIADIVNEMKLTISEHSLARIDYIQVVAYPSLEPIASNSTIAEINGKTNRVLIAVAVFYGRTRLIDNQLLTLKGGE